MFFIVAAAGIGLSLWEGYAGSQYDKQQAQINMNSIQNQMGLLDEEKKQLSTDYQNKRGNVRDRFGNRMDTLMSRLSHTMLESGEQERGLMAQSGLAHSGTVKRKSDVVKKGITSASLYGQQGLGINLKSTMDDLHFDENRDLAQIDMERERLRGEYKTQQAMSEEKFLGIFS